MKKGEQKPKPARINHRKKKKKNFQHYIALKKKKKNTDEIPTTEYRSPSSYFLSKQTERIESKKNSTQ